MPMFEFQCQGCGEDFEELLRRPDDTVDCPECGSSQVQRKLSVFGFKSSGSSRGESSYSASHSSSGCSGCAGGHCGSCGH